MDGLRKGKGERYEDGKPVPIDFSDFYQSSAWGETKELAYVKVIWHTGRTLRPIHVFRMFWVRPEQDPKPEGVEGGFHTERAGKDLPIFHLARRN